jgi:tetratricopeptide (TPR) repeat protein
VLHARIVEAIEWLYPDRLTEQVERLAHHAFRGEVWDNALTYGRQAGDRAAARSAHREAGGYFEQALVALEQLPERRDTLAQAIDLRFDLRNALLPLDEQARIFDHLRAAEALAERLGDDQRHGRIACYLCISFTAIGEHDSALAAGQRALALATTSGHGVPCRGRLSAGTGPLTAGNGVAHRRAALCALGPSHPARHDLPW